MPSADVGAIAPPTLKAGRYTVALPTEYAEIELHAELPKNLKNEYIHINNKLGFKP